MRFGYKDPRTTVLPKGIPKARIRIFSYRLFRLFNIGLFSGNVSLSISVVHNLLAGIFQFSRYKLKNNQLNLNVISFCNLSQEEISYFPFWLFDASVLSAFICKCKIFRPSKTIQF